MKFDVEALLHELKDAGLFNQDIADEIRAHSAELDACSSEVEAQCKLMDILKEYAVRTGLEDDEEDEEEPLKLTDEDQAYMDRATQSVEDFLKSKNWRYSTRKQRPDLAVYELGFTMENCSLRARIYVEANPNVCRVDAVLPITGEALYEYPLCEKITNFNYMKRFGSLKYDERDGEITYEYSFLIGHQIYPDELNRYLRAVLSSADDAYAEIKKCCVGRFKSKEVNEILTKVNALVEDISDD